MSAFETGGAGSTGVTGPTGDSGPLGPPGFDDVATGDLIAVDVDVAGTGAKGLGVILTFG